MSEEVQVFLNKSQWSDLMELAIKKMLVYFTSIITIYLDWERLRMLRVVTRVSYIVIKKRDG